MTYSTLPTPSKAALEASKQHKTEKEVRRDIHKIQEVDKDDIDALRQLHRYLDGKYQSCIANWGSSMWGYNKEFGFAYDMLDVQSLWENLQQMIPKIEAYGFGWNTPDRVVAPRQASETNVNVTVNNEVNVQITFEQAREKVEEMTSLTNEQTKEILERINAIEAAINGEGSKKTKWEKIKPVLVWLADKSFDVGMTIIPLLLNLQ